MTDTHQLTDEQRRLLEDCPREELEQEMRRATDQGLIDICQWEKSWTVDGYVGLKRGAYIPRAAVEAWLAEQDEREAEIERRIARLVVCKTSVDHFMKYEKDQEQFFVDKEGFPWANADLCPEYIPVPASRIRAALDAKRAAEKNPTYGPPPPEVKQAWREAQEDHFRDAAEKVEGPWEAKRHTSHWIVTNSAEDTAAAWFFCGYEDRRPYTEPEARALAEAEAARLNAKWREEQEAKRKADEISPELRRRLETKISGVILREDLGGKTVYVGKDGFFYPVMPPYADVPTLPCTVDQRKAFLREKGIEVTP